MASREDDAGPLIIIGMADFADARELGAALFDLLSDAAVANVGLSADAVVYVVAPDGTVCDRARLVRERLTDRSCSTWC